MPRDYEPYVWGEDTATTRASARDLVGSFIENQLDNGPGWIIIHGADAYEIQVVVTLFKKPRVRS